MKIVKRFCIFSLLIGILSLGVYVMFKNQGNEKSQVTYSNYGEQKQTSNDNSTKEKVDANEEIGPSYKTKDQETYKEQDSSEKKVVEEKESSSRGAYIPSEKESTLPMSQSVTITPSQTTIKPKLKPKFNKKIVAYVGGWRDLSKANVDYSKFNYINYAFLGVKPDFSLWSFQVHDDKNLKYLANLKKEQPHLKVMLAIGGWGEIDGKHESFTNEFRRITREPECAKIYIDNLMDYVKKYDLDGVTYDWEFPGVEDKPYYHNLLKITREAFDAEQVRTGKKLEISIDISGFQYNNIDVKQCEPYLDWMNIMAYNMHGGPERKHAANLYDYSSQFFGSTQGMYGEMGGYSGDKFVKFYNKIGMPINKITLGVAFHGRGNIPPGPDGQNNSAPSYYKIVNNYLNKNGYSRYWDDQAKAPLISNGQYYVSYEDTESLKYKTDYIKENNLAGIVYWEYFMDGTNELVNGAYNNLSK
ncbi:MAG TPA: hypothetical protein DGK91_10780 [Clostridium sp.]|jgi:chitinase|nr:hypothetical protein [Clostridia bacterium]HCW04949.1 hypothetical protein [Clostridium sp.]